MATTWIEERYLCERDGLKLVGRLVRPQNNKSTVPLAIMCHGFNSTHERWLPYQEAYAEAGIASYAFDFAGGSEYSQSDGSMLEMSVFTEQADLEAVIDTLSSLPWVDSSAILLMGASQGGFVAAVTAAAHPDSIRAMHLNYPAFVIPDHARERVEELGGIPERTNILDAEVGHAYYEGLLDIDVFEHIAAFEGPVLILHGGEDSIVPVEYSQRATELYQNARFICFFSEGHGFSDAGIQRAIEISRDFFLSYLD